MANYYNPERYPDPTAYYALKNIEYEERVKKMKYKNKIVEKSSSKR